MQSTRATKDGAVFLGLGIALFLLITFSIELAPHHAHGPLLQDFKAVYYSTRCLLGRGDPYLPADVEKIYLSESGDKLSNRIVAGQVQVITSGVYFPSMFLVVLPFALSGWNAAHVGWMAVSALALVAAVLITWRTDRQRAPVYTGILLALMLMGAFSILWTGNPAGLVIPFCVIATFCFLEDRWAAPGVLLLVIASMLKPHDTWIIVLYFLLAGGSGRKRAIQSIALASFGLLAGALWVWSYAPHWLSEMRADLKLAFAQLGFNNPGPSSIAPSTSGMIIDLQTIFSVFRDKPDFYNAASLLVSGGLIAAWIWLVHHAPRGRITAYFAIAAAAPLTILPTYHRVYDSYLLMLCVPAAAVLWRCGGRVRWVSGLLNAAAIILTSPFTLTALVTYADHEHPTLNTVSGKLGMILLERPVPLVLLALAVLYLWALAQKNRFVVACDIDA